MADPSEPSSSTTPARPFLEIRALLRAPGIASDPRKLVLATVGLLLLMGGWWGLDRAFGDQLPGIALPALGTGVGGFSGLDSTGPSRLSWSITEPFRMVVLPIARLFTRGAGFAGWSHAALMGSWAVLVWGIFGGAIARIAVVQAATNGSIGVKTALLFALRKSVSLVGAPLTPFLAVSFFAACSALFGLLYRIPGDVGTVFTMVLGFIPLALGLMMALILVGLAIGWPLMHVTVAAEGEDAPDALSRSYSYVNQRLVRYLAHWVVGLAIGAVGLIVATVFAQVVVGLADWGTSLGAPGIDGPGGPAATSRLFWANVVGLVIHGWIFSYFWSCASLIYLILRRDVDGTPWQDVFLPEQAEESFDGGLVSTPQDA